MRPRTLLLALSLLVPLAACGDDGGSSSDTTAGGAVTTASSGGGESSSTTAAATVPAGSDELIVSTTDLGDVLVGPGGLTVYSFDNDTATASACEGGCAGTWPPVDGEITVGDQLDPASFTTIERSDGTTQAVYNGHPLYTYAGDSAPGDTNGHGVGGVWHAIDSDGNPLA